MAILPILLIVIALLAGFGPKILHYVEIDKCLDSGGSYNQKEHSCEMTLSKQKGNN